MSNLREILAGNAPEREAPPEQAEPQETGGNYASVLHVSHGKSHSVHKIGQDGKAESSTHPEGGDQTCPLCGGSGEVEPEAIRG